MRVANLTRTFTTGRGKQKVVEAVRGISFDVERGERVAFIGPNGAGKSTSIKMFTGILYPTSGTASVLGMVPWEERAALAQRIGTLFGQRSQLWAELPPKASFRMLASIFGIDDGTAAARTAELGELLEATDLFDQPVKTLSLGQRMRCELAAALLHDPEILMLDEPSIGLDLVAKQRFRELLVRLNHENGTTVFLTSHDVADIEQVAERSIVVSNGQIIHDDSVAAMRQQFLSAKRIEAALEVPIGPKVLGAMARPGVTVLPSPELVLRVDVDTTVAPIRDVVNKLLENCAVTDLSVVDPPLEQVIAEIYETR